MMSLARDPRASSPVPIRSPDHPDSSLSKKFGRETVNYFSGVPVNRASWLRNNYEFLRRAFNYEKTQILVLKDLNPMLQAEGSDQLALFSAKDVISFTSADPFGPSDEKDVNQYEVLKSRPLVIFIGLIPDENVDFEHKGLKGRPIFAVDATPRGEYIEAAQAFVEKSLGEGKVFLETRIHVALEANQAAIFAQARSIMDWNLRNRFCGGCGQITVPGHSGYKRLCPPASHGADCPTRTGISNLSYPRTDTSIIVAVLSSDGKRLLLGRQTRYPPKWYSTLAGFLEPGESIEEAVRRETLEESGVRIGRVVIHSTQPWPYPSTLMVGAVAQALPDGETIDLGNDPELEDAKWYSFDEVRFALENHTLPLGAPPKDNKDADLLLPPPTAIANRLLWSVVNGFATAMPKM